MDAQVLNLFGRHNVFKHTLNYTTTVLHIHTSITINLPEGFPEKFSFQSIQLWKPTLSRHSKNRKPNLNKV